MTRSDFFEVARHAADRGLYVSLASNGTLLTKENVQKIKEAKVNYIDISIDGASAKTHDDFRGVPGTFDKALAGLKNCVEADLCVCIATTVAKITWQMPAIIDLAEEIHRRTIYLLQFYSHGAGQSTYEQDSSPQEREKVLRYLLNRMSAGCKTTILATAPQLARGSAMSGLIGHRRSDHVYGAHANRQSNQKSRSAWRLYRRVWSRQTLLFAVAARRCSPMRVFAC